MSSILINNMSSYLMGRLDKNIDTEDERKALAKNIVSEIEDKIGDIPILNDTQELKVIEDALATIHKGLKSISDLLNT